MIQHFSRKSTTKKDRVTLEFKIYVSIDDRTLSGVL